MRGNPPAADVIVEILEATDLRVGDLNGILFHFYLFFIKCSSGLSFYVAILSLSYIENRIVLAANCVLVLLGMFRITLFLTLQILVKE